MDLHPIFVHFPIALLVVYGIIELFIPAKFNNFREWVWVRFAMLLTGVGGAFLALQTGETAQRAYRGSALVHMHSFWASASTFAFGIILAVYVVKLLEDAYLSWIPHKKVTEHKKVAPVWNLLVKIQNLFFNTFVIKIIALFGLVAISITGALGGAIVYGPNVDPIVKWVYGIFF